MSKDQVIEGFRSIADDFDNIVDVDVAALVLMERVDALSARAAEALILADKMGCFDGIETWDRVQATALPVFNAAAPKVIPATPTASRLGDLLDNKRCRKAMDVSRYGLFLVMRAAENFAASEPGRIALPRDQQINVDPYCGRFRTIFCLPGISAPASCTWNEHILLRDHLDWLRLHPNDDCELASFCELKKQQAGIFASLFRVLGDLLDEAEPGDADEWSPPEGYVFAGAVPRSDGRVVPRTTVQGWAEKDNPKSERDPNTGAIYYEESWAKDRVDRYRPRPP